MTEFENDPKPRETVLNVTYFYLSSLDIKIERKKIGFKNNNLGKRFHSRPVKNDSRTTLELTEHFVSKKSVEVRVWGPLSLPD